MEIIMTTALPRITARVDSDTQELLSQAAAIAGMSSINSFVLSAAVEKAKTIMERERVLQLSEQDTMTLMAALDQPAKVNSKLQKAAARYIDKTQ
jgi:uncharacterized protein (DUF1778 family)